MLSRVARNLYWMSRSIERAENIARFVDVNMHLLMDLPVEETNQWESLIAVSGDKELFDQRYGKATAENVIEFLTFDTEYSNSLYCCLQNARENARTVRECISSELWRRINDMYLQLGAPGVKRRALAEPNPFYNSIKDGCMLLQGLSNATMTHGEAWYFMRLGESIERADKTSRILDVKYFILLPDPNYVNTAYDNIQWAAVLKSVSALEMFRLQYRRIAPKTVAEFLILNPEFPRAIRHCVARAEGSLHEISGSTPGNFTNAAERNLGRLSSELSYADIDEILNTGLHEYIDHIQAKLNTAGATIEETFFGRRPVAGGMSQSQTQGP